MNILILTGKFGMGHWSASQSPRQQLLRAFPGAEVEGQDFVAEAMPNASEAMYKCKPAGDPWQRAVQPLLQADPGSARRRPPPV